MLLTDVAAALPSPAELRRLSLAMAALDVMVSLDWEKQYFSFRPQFGPAHALASMDDNQGDTYAIVFGAEGTVVRGWDHEYGSVPTAAAGLPDDLRWIVDESLLGGPREMSCCFWTTGVDGPWRCGQGDDDGGAEWLLSQVLDGTPEAYRRFAASYYEEVLGPVVDEVYALRTISAFTIRAVNREADIRRTLATLADMGYPIVRP